MFEIFGNIPDTPRTAPASSYNDVFKGMKKKNQLQPIKSFGVVYPGVDGGFNRNSFRASEYNLTDVANAIDTESFLSQAINKYVSQMFRSGYLFIGKNKKAVDYIKRRFEQIEMVTKYPIDLFFRDVAKQLVGFSNAFIIKRRSSGASTGYTYRNEFGKLYKPIARYDLVDAATMQLSREDNGKVLRYKQEIPGVARSPEWSADDVIHIFYNRRVGNAFGTPIAANVLDDIRALRRMEEAIEILVWTNAVPWIHVKVGSEDRSADDSEIEMIQARIQNMEPEGGIVTDERCDIDVIGAGREALNAEPYLDYMKRRVWAGLGVSAVSFGEGDTANRGTAITIEKVSLNQTIEFVSTLKFFIDYYMIRELLMEGGFKWNEIDDTNKVEMHFPEIDFETRMEKANHGMALYQGHMITEDEARMDYLGREPISDDARARMYFELIQKPQAIIRAVDEPYLSTSPENATRNKNQPENQYGKKNAKTQPVNARRHGEDMLDSDVSDATSSSHRDFVRARIRSDIYASSLMNHYDAFIEDVQELVKSRFGATVLGKDDLALIMSLTAEGMKNDASVFILDAFRFGVEDACTQMGIDPEGIFISESLTFLRTKAEGYIDNLLDDIARRFVRDINDTDTVMDALCLVAGIFESERYRIDFQANAELLRAYNFGLLKAFTAGGVPEVAVLPHPNPADLCKPFENKVFDLRLIVDYDELPPYHGKCTHIIGIPNKAKS